MCVDEFHSEVYLNVWLSLGFYGVLGSRPVWAKDIGSLLSQESLVSSVVLGAYS